MYDHVKIPNIKKKRRWEMKFESLTQRSKKHKFRTSNSENFIFEFAWIVELEDTKHA